MANVCNSIRDWGIERGIDTLKPNKRVFISNVVEEILEGIGVKDDNVTEWMTREIWATENVTEPPSEEDYIDSLADIVVFAITEMTKYGYEPNLVMKEALKEISSRKQDPEQAVRWHKEGKTEGEKWQKWKEQQEESLYQANYSVCKRSK